MHILVPKARRDVAMLKMLCGERCTAMALLRKLTDAGCPKRIGNRKHLLQRGPPLRKALEQGKADQLSKHLHGGQPKTQQNAKQQKP